MIALARGWTRQRMNIEMNMNQRRMNQMDAQHPYMLEKLREGEKERLLEVDRNHWRKAQQDGERKHWRWGTRPGERRR
ncbi:hypothetical protein B9G55_09645 [Saccharibacillus sp. O16]|nr:hypothetical protein B9G55_09645 [Saccharibacillus sp. O16]